VNEPERQGSSIEGSREGPTEPHTIFVSDASAEAEAISSALREKGFVVADVPLAMLVARVSVQQPRVLLVDIDAEGAMAEIDKMRDLPSAGSIHVIFIGKPGGPIASNEDALAHEGSGFFPRPVDIEGLVKKVGALAQSIPPPVASVRPKRSDPAPQISLKRLSQPPPPTTSGRVVAGPLSAELESLLADAEARVGADVSDAIAPSPEEELAAVLPEDVLRALDEPIEGDDDAEDSDGDTGQRHLTSAGGAGRETTGAVVRRAPQTGTGIDPSTSAGDPLTGAHTGREPQTPLGSAGLRVPSTKDAAPPLFRSGDDAPAANDMAWLKPEPPIRPPRASTLGSEELVLGGGMLPAADPPGMSPMLDASRKAESVPPPLAAAAPVPSVLGPGDAAFVLARAIGDRTTGALCIEADGGIRRVVLREGDIVTAASSIDEDALIMFLAARGDLPRDVARQLSGRLPACGKHAGAALVAHGLLTQDQLWPTLRAHAEWIIARALLVERGTASIEHELVGRLSTEPNVFGGGTGASVFVDVVRRVVGPRAAMQALGGSRARFAQGARHSLLGECALSPAELDIVERAAGRTLEEIVGVHADSDASPMLYALALLGVVEAIHPQERSGPREEALEDRLDADAIRARIRARRALVDEGDYFAVLGVGRSATGYEVRRAFLELRRAFEPHRILTPELADLADDVRTIVAVLEEAYEILRDPVRRERYRRAIDAVPS
jgi:hypothetical protein